MEENSAGHRISRNGRQNARRRVFDAQVYRGKGAARGTNLKYVREGEKKKNFKTFRSTVACIISLGTRTRNLRRGREFFPARENYRIDFTSFWSRTAPAAPERLSYFFHVTREPPGHALNAAAWTALDCKVITLRARLEQVARLLCAVLVGPTIKTTVQ